jgi:quercetin dioxygenase-like cupin family protein
MVVQATRRLSGKVYAYDLSAVEWTALGRPGLHQKVIRTDDAQGHYLGLVGFDPMTRTGLHQHQGTAISYFLDGSMHDYDSEAVRGQAGVNLKGATHDALAYNRCVIAARLEGPVFYPRAEGADSRVHSGARAVDFVNPDPEAPPEINVTVDAIRPHATTIGGVTRRMIFDYRPTEDARRFVQLSLLPGARVPVHRTRGLVEWFVIAGDIIVNGITSIGGSFVILEPGTQVEMRTGFGAKLLAWAEAPIDWEDGSKRPDVYGF